MTGSGVVVIIPESVELRVLFPKTMMLLLVEGIAVAMVGRENGDRVWSVVVMVGYEGHEIEQERGRKGLL